MMFDKKIEIGICSPTYNEEKNIVGFLNDISVLNKKYKVNICFVDDGSKDRTIDHIKKNENNFNKIKVINRVKKSKMTAVYTAYLEGLKWLYKNTNSNYFAQIDSDRVCSSKDILDSFDLLIKSKETQMVKLSKYFGEVYDNRPFARVILSKIYTNICKFIYGNDISDYSTGVRFYKKEILSQFIKRKLKFQSPIGLLDDLLWIKKNNFVISEIAFKIKTREYGNSFFTFKILFRLGYDFFVCIIRNKFK